ncbi:MAG: gamma carbonic anhydrase family protein, partial [bacterium]
MTAALVLPWRGVVPRIEAAAWLAPNATVIGDVEIGAGSSIWFGAILRGDVNRIRVGRGTNIQDGSVVHVTRARFGT